MIDPKVFDFVPVVDFFKIDWAEKKTGYEVYPSFLMIKSKDLLTRGNDFHAVWLEDQGLWSTDEQDVINLVDSEVDRFVREYKDCFDGRVRALHMVEAKTHLIDEFHKYCQKQLRSSNKNLDEKLAFSNTKLTKKDYASKRLSYALEPGDISAYDTLISRLYSPEERQKIEWAIGSVVNGDSKKIQKFVVLYGDPGSGKGTVIKIIQQLFEGYVEAFDAKALGSSNNQFALEAFRSNPLVAIQHDGNLSQIEDNTRLNSLVSHEVMTVNEKFKSTYATHFNAFLFMGTNKPVKITDSKSGLIRRLIDVTPTGSKFEADEYDELMNKVKYELGGIAWHCKEVYESHKHFYDKYTPINMMGASNDFFNFMMDNYYVFKQEEFVTLKDAYQLYIQYCEAAKVPYPYSQRVFREELKSYFWEFKERCTMEDGTRVRSVYSDLREDRFKTDFKPEPRKEKPNEEVSWLIFEEQPSILDEFLADYPAQYANSKGTPLKKWDEVTTKLRDLDTSKLHYALGPENLVTIDFDIPDEDGNKSFAENVKAASKWPKTYAELSKGGEGIHLEYIYTGNIADLATIADEHVEIKVFTGKASLRRKLSKCNNEPIATISSGLPLKKGDKKVVNEARIMSEKGLRKQVMRNVNKEIHQFTKPSMDFIYEIVEGAYKSGMQYDITDMYQTIFNFAMDSTHNAGYCLNLLNKMHLKSDEPLEPAADSPEKALIFYDVEVFPNLFIICWKVRGENNPVHVMINPQPDEVSAFMTSGNLVGFNCRKYDNHIVYARGCLESNLKSLYNLSQKMINHKTGFIGEAYNLSYTDILDFSAVKQSLKKFEIELGIHHHELGLPWDKPVPEDMWEQVAEYCKDDVIATEAVFEARYGDFEAREILTALANIFAPSRHSVVNDTTNTLTGRIMFGDERNPQREFIYTDLATGEQYAADGQLVMPAGSFDICNCFPGYEFKNGKNMYRGEDVGFGGYVYAEPGMYSNVTTFDIISAHPTSMIRMNLFGERYTQRLKDLFDLRVALKHKDFDKARKMFGGQLAKYLTDEGSAKALAGALKIAINSIYGLTSASFDNPFRDRRNKNNIVALRAALFMVTLRDEIQAKGFTVCHIKTDSIKVVNPTKEIADFIYAFGRKYGYDFEIEHKFEKFCLVNNAVYIAKCAEDDPESAGMWTATGAQFAVPYVFKTLFSHEPIKFEDMCETKSVQTALYLDTNERLPDVSREEAELKKLRTAWCKEPEGVFDDIPEVKALKERIAKGHTYRFVGRVGQFCPMVDGAGGGKLMRETENKKTGETLYSYVTGTSEYRWQESEVVRELGRENDIDRSYYAALVDKAKEEISKYGDFEWFVSDDSGEPPWDAPNDPWNDDTIFERR